MIRTIHVKGQSSLSHYKNKHTYYVFVAENAFILNIHTDLPYRVVIVPVCTSSAYNFADTRHVLARIIIMIILYNRHRLLSDTLYYVPKTWNY